MKRQNPPEKDKLQSTISSHVQVRNSLTCLTPSCLLRGSGGGRSTRHLGFNALLSVFVLFCFGGGAVRGGGGGCFLVCVFVPGG